MDVKIAFLNGYLEDHISIEQPEGYADKEQPDLVRNFVLLYL